MPPTHSTPRLRLSVRSRSFGLLRFLLGIPPIDRPIGLTINLWDAHARHDGSELAPARRRLATAVSLSLVEDLLQAVLVQPFMPLAEVIIYVEAKQAKEPKQACCAQLAPDSLQSSSSFSCGSERRFRAICAPMSKSHPLSASRASMLRGL